MISFCDDGVLCIHTYVLWFVAYAISDGLLEALEILLDVPLLLQNKHCGDTRELLQLRKHRLQL